MLYSAVIVDDEHFIRSSLEKKVNEIGTVLVAGTADNGVKCLQWLDKMHTDICITDVRMPHMDGLELLRNINAKYPDIVSIVISSYEDFTYVRSSMQLNAIDYVLKPIERHALQDAVTKAVMSLKEKRRHVAMSIVVKQLLLYEKELKQWVDMSRTLHIENMQVLATDTIAMFEQWIDNESYLLGEIVIVWIEFVLERITKQKCIFEPPQLQFEHLFNEPIALNQKQFVFRQLATSYMEYGIKQMVSVVKTMKSQMLHPSVERTKLYLQEHYTKKINLQEVADAVSMSKTYLANLFKQETGMTTWNYLLDIRMEQARALLLSTNYKSYEIAHMVGYENSIHFSKLFKEKYGLNPAELKKRLKEQY